MARIPAPDPEFHKREDASLYALGLLEGAERENFERHLGTCPACRALVEQDQELIAQLSAAEPERDPSPELEARLWKQIAEDLARAQPSRTESARLSRWRSIHLPSLAAALAAVTLLLVLGFFIGRTVVLREQLISVPLEGGARGDSYVTIYRSGATEVALKGLPDPPPGYVYQAWVVSDGARVAAATYDDGNGTFPLEISALGQRVEITVEPAPGSEAPTGPPILRTVVGP